MDTWKTYLKWDLINTYAAHLQDDIEIKTSIFIQPF